MSARRVTQATRADATVDSLETRIRTLVERRGAFPPEQERRVADSEARLADARRRLDDAQTGLAAARAEEIAARHAVADARVERDRARVEAATVPVNAGWDSELAAAINEAAAAGVDWATISAWMGSGIAMYARLFRDRAHRRR